MADGVHGDEYEGQIALMKPINAIDPRALSSRLIVVASLSLPAVAAARRMSPLDGYNLNRRVGRQHHLSEPDWPSRELFASVSGIMLTRPAGSPAGRGDRLAVIAQPAER
jgi:hypothetical protein